MSRKQKKMLIRILAAAVLLIGCLYAWVLIARGGWWGAAYPVIHALLLWNLYRALYPKNIPDMPENE